MDYLQLRYLQPIQVAYPAVGVGRTQHGQKHLPELSESPLFQNNVTFNTNEDFRSQFNSDWAGKLLIVVDEVLLNRRERDSERLKEPQHHTFL